MAPERWEIDSGHSGLHFSVRHMVVARVRGRFARWTATIHTPESDFAGARIEAWIDATSVDTGLPERDAHLRSTDFLDTARHPEMTFASRRVERAGTGRLRVIGDLTIAGVTREVALEVVEIGRTVDPWGNQRAGFTVRTSIDRADFGLRWNVRLAAGGLMVGERVDVEIDIEAVKQPAAKAA